MVRVWSVFLCLQRSFSSISSHDRISLISCQAAFAESLSSPLLPPFSCCREPSSHYLCLPFFSSFWKKNMCSPLISWKRCHVRGIPSISLLSLSNGGWWSTFSPFLSFPFSFAFSHKPNIRQRWQFCFLEKDDMFGTKTHFWSIIISNIFWSRCVVFSDHGLTLFFSCSFHLTYFLPIMIVVYISSI